MNQQRKKILFLITKSNWGGAQRYVYDLATTLPREQYEVVVALGGDGVLIEKLHAAGVRVIQIPSLQRDISLYKELRSFYDIAMIIRTEDPDVFHINSSKAGGIGAFLGRVLGVPRVVFTAHGWAFNEDRPGWQKLVIKFLQWLTVRLAHVTIAVSNGLKAQLNWRGMAHRMVVVNPGRTIGAFETRAAARGEIVDFAPALRSHISNPWIGTIAELHPIKRFAIVIEAIQKLLPQHPNLRYIIIGDGERRKALEQKVAEVNLSDHIFFVGAITEAARLLPAFDLFTLASKSESYGYVLLEAGQASLPVVATNVGGIPDIITHKETGLLVPSEDAAALADALEQILSHPEKGAAFGRALNHTTSTRTVEKMTTETEVVYAGANSRT